MKTIIAALSVLVLVSCDGSTGNPATEDRNDLNPPMSLMSVTGDGKVQLTWKSFNAEDDFQGFMVFGSKQPIDDGTENALWKKVKYPRELSAASELEQVVFPRCADNSKFFEAFGFPESDADCEGATQVEEKPQISLPGGRESTLLLADDEKLTNWLKCTDDGEAYTNDNLSVKVSGGSLTEQKCTVATVIDGGSPVAMENGTIYTFFVMAIMDDDFSKASWASNLVEDAPSKDIFQKATVTLKYGATVNNSDFANNHSKSQYVRFALNGAEAITAPTPASCEIDSAAGGTDKSKGVCVLDGVNDMAATLDGIYIARDGSSDDYQQRLFISTPSNGKIDLQPVGPATIGSYSGRLPGDEATTSFPTSKGAKFAIDGDQIFDFKITHSDGTYNYGKVIINTIANADVTNNQSDVTVEVTIVYQPKAATTYYLQ